MFVANEDLSVFCTRGDYCEFPVKHDFKAGDVIRFKATRKKDCNTVVIQRDFVVEADTDSFMITLSGDDTKIGEVISKPVDYWYEIELNPYTNPQTIIGYDEDGAKIFKLFPEGDDLPDEPIEPEVVKVIDEELDLTSTRPVQNQAIARAVAQIESAIEGLRAMIIEMQKEG